MIDLLIYQLHLIALAYTFSKYWKMEGLKAAFMSITLALLVFLICWTMSATLSYYIYPSEYNNIYFSNNTLSLILILYPEYLYYKNFVFNK
jgi:hypothetical protein